MPVKLFFNWLRLSAALQEVAATRVRQPLLTVKCARSPEDFLRTKINWSESETEFPIDLNGIQPQHGPTFSPAPRTRAEAMRRYLDYSNIGPYPT